MHDNVMSVHNICNVRIFRSSVSAFAIKSVLMRSAGSDDYTPPSPPPPPPPPPLPPPHITISPNINSQSVPGHEPAMFCPPTHLLLLLPLLQARQTVLEFRGHSSAPCSIIL